ncbi:hypothetical protein BH09PSE3_BH09PSE3_27830 [soil metagenome]
MTEKIDDFDIARDPLWLAHRYDAVTDAFHFVEVSRDEQNFALFLTDDYLPTNSRVRAIGRDTAVDAVRNSAQLHYIFHSAFCCSTLLARALNQPGLAMSLKEPVILNDLVGWRRRGGTDADVLRRLDAALAMMARPFGQGESVVIKPSNVGAAFFGAMLDLRTDSTAVLLYAPLRTYVGSIAKKGLWGRLWVRELFAGFREDGLIGLGLNPADDIKLTDLQICAIGWLAQHALFARLIERLGPTRVRSLESETLIADPKRTLNELFKHFGWGADIHRVAEIVEGPEFHRHSKTDIPFSEYDRHREQIESANIHADEIDKVIVWAETIAMQNGIEMILPQAL